MLHILFILHFSDVERGTKVEVNGDGEECDGSLRAGRDDGTVCGMSSQIYVLIASIIILAIGIYLTVHNLKSMGTIILGVAAVILAVLGLTKSSPGYYCALFLALIVYAVADIFGLVHKIEGFEMKFNVILNIVLSIIAICFVIHLAIVCNSLRRRLRQPEQVNK